MTATNEEIKYPNPTCPTCNSKKALMFYQGKIECSDCSTIVWSIEKENLK